MNRWLALAALASALAPGCSCDGPRTATQVVVIIDGDDVVRNATTDVHVEVFGGPAESPPAFPDEPKDDLSFPVTAGSGWPRTLALAPENRDATRLYRVVATATNSSGAVAVARVISGYVPNDVRVIRLYLSSACDPEECTPSETCDPILARCVPAEVDPEDLPPYAMDAGVVDGGVTDGGGLDAGRSDASPDAALDPCPGGCDDGVDCTDDECTPSGCSNTSNDVLCDDSNECTVDACGATDCTHAPQAGTGCDDDLFCNGLDTCDAAGECTLHTGDPCMGTSLTCNAATEMCEGMCTTDTDCPDDTMGAFGSCDYADGCDEAASQSRTIIDWACTSRRCVATERTDTMPCTRATAGLSCGTGGCTAYGACNYADACDEAATQTRDCTALVCRSGTCTGETNREMIDCNRTTTGAVCGTPMCGAYGTCMVATECGTAGEQSRTCRNRVCGGGTCSGTSGAGFVEMQSCTGPRTEGNACGSCGMCMSEVCSEVTRCDAGMDGGRDAGPDVGIDGGSDGGVPFETGPSIRDGSVVTLESGIGAN